MSAKDATSTTDLSKLIHHDEAVLVLGALNADPQDRYLKRSQIRPVQLIDQQGLRPVPCFDKLGELGVSSLAWHPKEPTTLYVTTGDDLRRIELAKKRISTLDVPRLKDVHEMTMVGDILWLANTGFDEIVAFDTLREHVSKRISLIVRKTRLNTRAHYTQVEDDENLEVVEKFHSNQVFEGFDRELYVLVHHVSGRQLIRRVAQKVIKNRGDGGVVGLSNSLAVPLGLKGPHTVRKIDGKYWVMDSGQATLNIYEPNWTLTEKLPTEGWGRGASLSERLQLFYAGISETRKRYLSLSTSRSEPTPNMVLVFSTRSKMLVGRIILSRIEQVNNVYLISREVARGLLDLERPSCRRNA
jgi:hypothetical protein